MNFNFFKTKKDKILKSDLEKAKEQGFISEEEFLELEVKRAEKRLKEFQNSKIRAKK